MKRRSNIIGLALLWMGTLAGFSQGYIVPNGVTFSSFQAGLGYGINVMHDPANLYYTGFYLNPTGGNTFQFDPLVDVGVRTFLVSANDPINLQAITSDSYTELTPGNYTFANGIPFYVGLYTGNVAFAPPNGIYDDPLFGWAELENINGTIEFLGGAEEYQGGGILTGTQTIQPVPEPAGLALMAIGALILMAGWRCRQSLRQSGI